MAVLCVLQLFTANGRVLWLFDTGYPDVFGTMPSYNNYAQFVELALPVATWEALCNRDRALGYALAAGVLFASVIGSTSRAGAILCTAELLVVPAVAVLRSRHSSETGRPNRLTRLLAVTAAAVLVFTFVIGWERILKRFEQRDPYFVRRELVVAAADMMRERPWIGYGLGSFPLVYPAHARKEFAFQANHVHNDWAEFAAEGGLPFLVLTLIPFVVLAPRLLRTPWALGIVALSLHACVDYPFPRPAVSAWLYLMLGML
jgi:O-antigen ligase